MKNLQVIHLEFASALFDTRYHQIKTSKQKTQQENKQIAEISAPFR